MISPTATDFPCLAEHLARRYGSDPREAATALYEVAAYLVREPDPADTAAQLRHLVGVVNGLAVALDAGPLVAEPAPLPPLPAPPAGRVVSI